MQPNRVHANALLREALEAQFISLDELSLQDPDALVCANCYTPYAGTYEGEPIPDCECPEPLLWPIRHVISKVKLQAKAISEYTALIRE